MKLALVAAALVAAAAPVSAQKFVKSVNPIEQAIVAMNDGPEIGGQVVEILEKKGISVSLEPQAQPSKRVNASITLSDKLAAAPRTIAPRIAWETAELMLADMPDCSEREYMRRSMAARVYLELGGDRKAPADLDAALLAELKPWLDNKSEMALYVIGEKTGKKSLMELMDAENDAAKRMKLGLANTRFIEYLRNEQEAR